MIINILFKAYLIEPLVDPGFINLPLCLVPHIPDTTEQFKGAVARGSKSLFSYYKNTTTTTTTTTTSPTASPSSSTTTTTTTVTKEQLLPSSPPPASSVTSPTILAGIIFIIIFYIICFSGSPLGQVSLVIYYLFGRSSKQFRGYRNTRICSRGSL